MERARSRAVLVVLVLALGVPLVTFSRYRAEAQTPAQPFACRASAVNLLGVEPVVANRADLPCAPESQGISGLTLAGLGIRALTASTGSEPGDGGVFSRTVVGELDLSLVGLRADLVEAEARVTCVDGQPRATGTSRVVGLTVNGVPVDSGAPLDVPLPVGTLRLNQVVAEGSAVTVRAVSLEIGSASVVLGEARAASLGNPCASITIRKTATVKTSQEFSFQGDLGSFVLRDAPDSGPESRTFSRPPGRYEVRELPVAGGPIEEAWRVNSIVCSDPDGGTPSSEGTRSVVIDLDPGENIVCTFANGNLIVEFGAVALAPENPSRGVDIVTAKRDPDAEPPVGSRVDVELPTERDEGSGDDRGRRASSPPVEAEARTSDASVISATTLALISVPLLALIAGGFWLFLVAARRRREDDAAR